MPLRSLTVPIKVQHAGACLAVVRWRYITGIIGACTGIVGALLSYVNYRRVSNIKAMPNSHS